METAKETKKIGFVCFVSAFVGTFLTLAAAIEFGLGWWLAPLGAMVFGTLAYLGYNWHEVGAALAYAWRQTIRWRPRLDWPERLKPERLKVVTYLTLGFPASIMLPVGAATGAVIGEVEHLALGMLLGAAMGVMGYWLLLSFSAVLVVTPDDRRLGIEAAKKFFRDTNLLACCWWIGWAAIWCAGRIPRATSVLLKALGRFAKASFLYLHREERRICFTATAIGVLAGFTAGWQSGVILLGSLVGGAVGCLVGILEYELVARRWLKLLPAATRV